MTEPDMIEPSTAEDEPASLTPAFTSDIEIDLEDASWAMQKRGAEVVLLMAETGWGKTTLLVEIWNEFLAKGKIGSVKFAGSLNPLAFERRAHDSRITSGNLSPETLRTYEYDDGLLHLSVQGADGIIRDLLLSDVAGEHFERLSEGNRLGNEFSWIPRVDRFLVLIDGAGLADPTTYENVSNSARRQLYALMNEDRVASSSKVAIVVTKSDAVPKSHSHAKRFKESLLGIAQAFESSACVIDVAARPLDMSDPKGLGDLMDWLVSIDRPLDNKHTEASITTASRAFERP